MEPTTPFSPTLLQIIDVLINEEQTIQVLLSIP